MKLIYALSNVLFMLAVVIIAATLSGCSSTTKLVTKTSTLYQEVPAELTLQVKPKPPVDRVVYLAMPVYERERYLSEYSVELLKGLYSCNSQLSSISTLSSQWKAQSGQLLSP